MKDFPSGIFHLPIQRPHGIQELTGYANSHIFSAVFVWFPLKRDESKTAAEEGRAGIVEVAAHLQATGDSICRWVDTEERTWPTSPDVISPPKFEPGERP